MTKKEFNARRDYAIRKIEVYLKDFEALPEDVVFATECMEYGRISGIVSLSYGLDLLSFDERSAYEKRLSELMWEGRKPCVEK